MTMIFEYVGGTAAVALAIIMVWRIGFFIESMIVEFLRPKRIPRVQRWIDDPSSADD